MRCLCRNQKYTRVTLIRDRTLTRGFVPDGRMLRREISSICALTAHSPFAARYIRYVKIYFGISVILYVHVHLDRKHATIDLSRCVTKCPSTSEIFSRYSSILRIIQQPFSVKRLRSNERKLQEL